jgi:hypothetical protein
VPPIELADERGEKHPQGERINQGGRVSSPIRDSALEASCPRLWHVTGPETWVPRNSWPSPHGAPASSMPLQELLRSWRLCVTIDAN